MRFTQEKKSLFPVSSFLGINSQAIILFAIRGIETDVSKVLTVPKKVYRIYISGSHYGRMIRQHIYASEKRSVKSDGWGFYD